MSDVLQIPINATDDQRRAYFYLTSDGTTPVTNAAGGQPELAWNSGTFSTAGIGTLVSQGNGYYSSLLSNFVTRGYRVGDVLRTRFDNGSTIETPGSTIEVVRPFYSSHHYPESGVQFINTNSGNLTRRNVVFTPAGRYHN